MKNFKYVALLGQVGLVIVIPLIAAFFIGQYLRDNFGLPGYFVVVLALLGLLSGLYNAYKLLMKW